MFWPVLASTEAGKLRSWEIMLRDQAWPHCGWSAPGSSKHQDPSTKIQGRSKHQAPNDRPLLANFWFSMLGSSLELGCWRLDVKWSIALCDSGDSGAGAYREISLCFKMLNWCRRSACSAISLSSTLRPRIGFPCG